MSVQIIISLAIVLVAIVVPYELRLLKKWVEEQMSIRLHSLEYSIRDFVVDAVQEQARAIRQDCLKLLNDGYDRYQATSTKLHDEYKAAAEGYAERVEAHHERSRKMGEEHHKMLLDAVKGFTDVVAHLTRRDSSSGQKLKPDAVLADLIDRFLNWPLPDSVCSDTCASTPGYPHRTGTTLLSAVEAEQMLRYVLNYYG
jgi:hypothetical protein